MNVSQVMSNHKRNEASPAIDRHCDGMLFDGIKDRMMGVKKRGSPGRTGMSGWSPVGT